MHVSFLNNHNCDIVLCVQKPVHSYISADIIVPFRKKVFSCVELEKKIWRFTDDKTANINYYFAHCQIFANPLIKVEIKDQNLTIFNSEDLTIPSHVVEINYVYIFILQEINRHLIWVQISATVQQQHIILHQFDRYMGLDTIVISIEHSNFLDHHHAVCSST